MKHHVPDTRYVVSSRPPLLGLGERAGTAHPVAAFVPGTSADGQDISLRHRPRGSPPRLHLLRCSPPVCRPQGPQPRHRRGGHRRERHGQMPTLDRAHRGGAWCAGPHGGAAYGIALGSHVTGASTPSALHEKRNPTITGSGQPWCLSLWWTCWGSSPSTARTRATCSTSTRAPASMGTRAAGRAEYLLPRELGRRTELRWMEVTSG